MKAKKFFGASVLLSVCLCVSALTVNASAASNKAVSVGVKYYQSSTDTYDDYVTNATNAKTAYASISSVNSSLVTAPTETNLKSNLQNSRIIFLNSHSSATSMTFNYYNSGGTLVKCGIKKEESKTGYTALSSMSLSNVDLITFVGCNTAENVSGGNLIGEAVKRGAKAAVGFDSQIVSRSASGKAWCKSYNNYLAQGCSVYEAILKATSDNPSSDLGAAAKIDGTGSQTVASASKAIAEDTSTTYLEVEIDLNDIEDLGDILLMANISPNDNLEYRYYVNIFDEQGDRGYVVFNGYLPNDIITSRAYIGYIENGIITTIAQHDIGKPVNQNAVMNKFTQLSSKSALLAKSTFDNIYDITERYEYDFSTDELRYIKTVFTVADDGTIVENTSEIVI